MNPGKQIGFTFVLGLILGMAGIGLNLTFYLTGWIWEMWSPGILMILRFLLFLFLGAGLIYTLKSRFPGFYPFRRIFANFLLIGFVSTCTTNFYNYWFETVLEPQFSLRYLTGVQETMKTNKQEYLKNQANETEFNKMMKNIETGIQEIKTNPTTFFGVFMGGFKHGFFYSLITGLVITILFRDFKANQAVL